MRARRHGCSPKHERSTRIARVRTFATIIFGASSRCGACKRTVSSSKISPFDGVAPKSLHSCERYEKHGLMLVLASFPPLHHSRHLPAIEFVTRTRKQKARSGLNLCDVFGHNP